ncbi:hypothetical protein BDV93DRAFT_439897 [Ceratobasidium sp. AG-I]|nr:hypothetical protein BDV93DRAFT_439897 [Ceratobasidium sp. AG-I]
MLTSRSPHDCCTQASVEKALRAGLPHPSGDFAYAHSSTATPNPGLVVDGAGVVGLPLNIPGNNHTHAMSLISGCKQTPFGQGERAILGKEVRDTWQADAAQVHFTNPAWSTYIEKAVKSVCVTLGVGTGTATPKYEFHKLMVYGEGSHFLPHVEAKKTDAMFATMLVILPSYFEGGAVHLAFNDTSKVVDFGGASSAFQTSVAAWYTDVTCEFKPITGGYRLALTYNLFRPMDSPTAPLVPVNDPSASDLRQALTVWAEAIKQGGNANAPRALAWLLEHKYSRASMCFALLKGRDVHTVRRALLAAEDLGLCLGLAMLTLRIDRPNDEDYGWDSDDAELQAQIQRKCCVKYLVDLEGHVVSERLRFTIALEGEMMPIGWKEGLERVTCDSFGHAKHNGTEGVGIRRCKQ